MNIQIKALSELIDVPRNTILAWERRYAVVSPSRLPNGYRVYSPGDVLLFRQVKSLVDQGHRVSAAVQMAKHQPVVGRLPSASIAALREQLHSRLVACDRVGASHVRQQLYAVAPRQVLYDVYEPLLHTVGQQWACGELNIAEEHFASAFIREHLVSMFVSLDERTSGSQGVICASLDGEAHEFGLLMVAIEFAMRGAPVTYLGADLPYRDLVEFARTHHPTTVALSVINTVDPTHALCTVLAIREALPKAVRLVVGGPGTVPLVDRTTEHLWFCPTVRDYFGRIDPAIVA